MFEYCMLIIIVNKCLNLKEKINRSRNTLIFMSSLRWNIRYLTGQKNETEAQGVNKDHRKENDGAGCVQNSSKCHISLHRHTWTSSGALGQGSGGVEGQWLKEM